MPRTGRRRSLSIAAALVAVLCAPAAAQAATYAVKRGEGACNAPGDLLCGGLADAATAANTGDVFNIESAAYGSATFDVNVTLAGNPTFGVNGSLAFTGNGGAASKIQHLVLAQVNGS